MTIKMTMILAGAGLALAGCGGGGGGIAPLAGPVVLEPAEVPTVMSADVDENTVRVTGDLATITVNSLDLDEETFSVTFGLPDGTSVTITEDDIDSVSGVGINSGHAIRVVLENDDGDLVGVLIGLEFGAEDDHGNIAEVIDQSLFVLARVDPDPDGEDPDLGIDTYMVTGDETGTLPSGSAKYHGLTIASVYQDGALVDDHVTGSVFVEAFFDDSTVDIFLSGSGVDVDSYTLHGEDLAIDGSSYGGTIDGVLDIDSHTDITGDLIGAFFGDLAEATAGVFGAAETELEALINERDVEIVGGFAAYVDSP